MDSDDTHAILAGIEAVRDEVAEVKGLLRELLGVVRKLDDSTNESAAKITAAIQRWT